MKKLILVISYLLITSILSPVNTEGYSEDKSYKVFHESKCEHRFNYTYVWELRNGVWWIIVYDKDGKFVNEYPAE